MAGIDVKMGVSGLSEFKNNLNAAKQSLKTMDAQLTLTENEFKATGNAEKYMQDRTVELNAKLKMHEAVLDNAEKALKEMTENGVDKGSKAFQEMQREVLNAQSAMLKTKNEIDNLGKEAGETASDTKGMNTELKNIGKQVSFETVHNGLKRITDGMEKAARAAYKVGKAVVQEVLGAGSWADDLLTTSTVLGVSPDELQRMQKTANIIDTDAETIIKARQKLSKGIGQENKATLSALEMLGISSNGDPEDIFWKAGEAIMNLSDETEQEARANDLFGRSWHDLIPLFSAGREEYEKMNASWKVLSDDQLNSLGKMDDEYQKLKANIEELKMEALSQFAEPMAQAMQSVNEAITKFSEWIQSDEGKAFTESVIGKVKDALMWLTDPKNIDTVKGAAIAIGGAWTALKVGQGVTTLANLISGIKGLGGAAAAETTGAAFGGSWAAGFASAALKVAPWLAGLTLLTENAFKAQGNDDLIDENGNLTETAKAAGFDLNGNGELITPKENYDYVLDALRPGSEWNTTGEEVDNTQLRLRNARTGLPDLDNAASKMEQAASELSGGTDAQKQSSSEMIQAAGTLEGMPGQVEAAIIRGMSGIKIYIDGATAGRVVSPYVGAQMGGLVAALTK